MSTRPSPHLRRLFGGLALAAVGVLALVHAVTIYACTGTPIVSCSRSCYVSKFVTGNIVHPGTNAPIVVPVNVLPYCTWNTATTLGGGVPICGRPTAATLMLTVECTSVTTGVTTTVGPISVPVSVPTTPGPQPMPVAAPNSTVGGVATFTIPANTLPAGDQYRCKVRGVYEVTFSAPGSRGLGAIQGFGDTEFCVVEPSPADPSVPRLDMQLVTLHDGGFNLTRGGDQAFNAYLVSNNDPVNSVVFSVSAGNEQAARLPIVTSLPLTATAPVHAISNPAAGTDGSPGAFHDGFDLGGILSLPDPNGTIDALGGDYFLAPGQIVVIPVIQRSHGMCMDGSCTENVVRLEGAFYPSGTPAVGCAGSLTLVDEARADPAFSTPQCELSDQVFADADHQVFAGAAVINGKDDLSTFGAPNYLTNTVVVGLPGESPTPGTQVLGARVWQLYAQEDAGFQIFPQTFASGLLRTEEEIDQIEWSMDVYLRGSTTPPEVLGDFPVVNHVRNRVLVKNFGNFFDSGFPTGFSIPVVGLERNGNLVDSDLFVFHDFQKRKFVVKDGNKTVYTGSTEDFFNDPRGLVSINTSRGFGKNPLDSTGPLPEANPVAVAYNVLTNTFAVTNSLPVFVNANAPDQVGSGFAGTMLWNPGNGTTLEPASGSVSYGVPVQFQPYTTTVSLAPAPAEVGLLTLNASGAARSRTFLPVAIRAVPITWTSAVAIDPGDLSAVSVKIDYKTPEKPKDTLAIKFEVPIPEGKSLDDEVFALDFGGIIRTFTLDGAGKPKQSQPGDAKFRLKIKSKKGVVAAQTGKATLTIKKADLSGFLKDEGVVDADIQAGLPTSVRFRYLFCGEVHEGRAVILLKGKAGKSVTGKLQKQK